jgi:flagellar hook protein FlgE
MGTALTELIVMQKAFDASAKSITTSDQMIQNAINMKK